MNGRLRPFKVGIINQWYTCYCHIYIFYTYIDMLLMSLHLKAFPYLAIDYANNVQAHQFQINHTIEMQDTTTISFKNQ